MKDAVHNRTETDTWQPLRAANARVLNELQIEPNAAAVAAATSPDRTEKKNCCASGREEKQRTEQREINHRAAVDHGLKRLAAFERRARGIK
jgi:hypothetical protein